LSQFFVIHPETPQKRLIQHACEIISKGGVVVYPTDTSYAVGCHIGDKRAVERIRQIRRLDDKHLFTLVCRDLSDLGVYARVNNSVFRQLKAHTPGPFTFVPGSNQRSTASPAAGKTQANWPTGSRQPDSFGFTGTLRGATFEYDAHSAR